MTSNHLRVFGVVLCEGTGGGVGPRGELTAADAVLGARIDLSWPIAPSQSPPPRELGMDAAAASAAATSLTPAVNQLYVPESSASQGDAGHSPGTHMETFASLG